MQNSNTHETVVTIDIRLIMFTPTGRDQVNNIQERIERDLEIMLEEIE